MVRQIHNFDTDNSSNALNVSSNSVEPRCMQTKNYNIVIDIKKNPEKYLRQQSIYFDFCNLSSSGDRDVVYKERSHFNTNWLLIYFTIYFSCLCS